jgi:hypothetical protein
VRNLASTGIRSPDRPARSQSLYRLSYPGPKQSNYFEKLNFERVVQKLSDQSTVSIPDSGYKHILSRSFNLCSSQGVTLTTYLHLMPKLIMRQATPPLPHIMERKGKNLRLYILPNYKQTVK